MTPSSSPRWSLIVLSLFSLSGASASAFAAAPAPRLTLADGQATASWPVTGNSYALESTADLGSGVWSAVSVAPVQASETLSVAVPLKPKAEFFRLRRSSVPAIPAVAINADDPDVGQTAPGSYGETVSDPSPFGGICDIPLFGSIGTNVLDASDTAVPGTDNSKLSYNWKFYYPEGTNGGVQYIDLNGRILGVDTPVVTINANALPDLGTISGENEWRVFLTITNNAGPTPQVSVFHFRFRYIGSGLVIALTSTNP